MKHFKTFSFPFFTCLFLIQMVKYNRNGARFKTEITHSYILFFQVHLISKFLDLDLGLIKLVLFEAFLLQLIEWNFRLFIPLFKSLTQSIAKLNDISSVIAN